MDFSAAITAGEATGGRAEFYIDGVLIGTDASIASGDTQVTFSSNDGSPTSAEVQAAITSGGVVSVKLYDAAGNSATATGPTLVRDVSAPTPTAITLSPSGGTVVANTLNDSNTAMDFSAAITAGEATGGRAEFYIDGVLIGTDASIASGDTQVTFSSNDGSPTSAEVQAAITSGGVVSVKLYDAAGNSATATGPTLVRDVSAPTPTAITLSPSGGTVVANTLNDSNTAMDFSAAITAGEATGGRAEFYIDGVLIGTDASIASGDTQVTFSSNDGSPTSAEVQAAITSGGVVSVKLYDAAGNSATATGPTLVRDVSAPTPTAITLSPSGGTVVANTLNDSNTAMDFSAAITAGEATGGRAEFYIDGVLIGTDASIASGDTQVTFSSNDGSPTSAEVQAAITSGGVVSVKLYDAAGNSATATGPTLVRDVSAPTPTAITLSPSGGTVVANTLNDSNTAMDFSAAITAGEATGGKAEFYIDGVLIGTDASIAAGDTQVTFSSNV
jgi:hypothetical protein